VTHAKLSDNERAIRAAAFATGARDYDRYRPTYPPAVMQRIVELVPPTTTTEVIEVGSGTGQLTIPLLDAGYRVTAIDISSDMLSILNDKVDGNDRCTVINTTFDDFDNPISLADLVVAPTSFHWMDPTTRAAKVKELLVPRGVVVLLFSGQARGGTQEFWDATEEIYERVCPASQDSRGDAIVDLDEIELHDFDSEFSDCDIVEARAIPWDVTYSTSDYIGLLSTYSLSRILEASVRQTLLDEIGSLIDTKFGGQIVKRYGFAMTAYRKRS
jgi:SAM-dependent methyltransferase